MGLTPNGWRKPGNLLILLAIPGAHRMGPNLSGIIYISLTFSLVFNNLPYFLVNHTPR